MIHIFSDSHGAVFYRPFNYALHYLGPVTMHRVGRDGTRLFAHCNEIRDGDTAVFIFGEIDVRCHIGKQRDEKGREMSEVIETLVSSYIKTITEYRRRFDNLNCIVQLVVPPTDQYRNPDFPFYGSLADRIRITKLVNDRLMLCCKQNAIGVLDLTKILSLEDGRLNPEMSDGTVHASKGALRFYEKELLEKIPRREKLKIRFRRSMDRMFITRLWQVLKRVRRKLVKPQR